MQPTLIRVSLGFLQNASLLALGVVIYAWLRGIIARWPRVPREALEGIYCATLAVLCMTTPIVLVPGVRLDARNALISIATIFGGPVSGLIATFVAIAYRLWLGGIGAMAGAVSIITAYAVTFAFAIWLKRTRKKFDYRYLALLAVGLGVSLLLALPILPARVALQMLQTAGVAGFTIVPGSIFILGGIVLLFERGRAAEAYLIESERRLASIIDNLPQPLAITDHEGKVLQVNKAYERIAGVQARELLGRSSGDLWQKIGVDGGAPLLDLDAQVWKTKQPHTAPLLPAMIGGRRSMVVVSAFPIRGADAALAAVGTITNDVTEIIEARESLAQRQAALERQQRALLKIAQANAVMEQSLTFPEAVRAITEVAGDALQVEYTNVFEIDQAAGISHCADEWVRSHRRHQHTPDIDMRNYTELISDLDRERVVAITDPMDVRLAARRDVLMARGVRGGILAAIYLGKHFIGHVGFVHVGSQRQWTPEELAFARSVADSIALMFVTTRHREALASLDLVDDAIYVEREDGRVIYANRAALILAGLPDNTATTYGHPTSFPRPPESLRADHDFCELAWPQNDGLKELELHRTKPPWGGVVTVIEDVTKRNLEQREHDRLQSQIQQATKMEAIGRFSSGIAHDFNNLLGAVIGFARFLEQDLPADTPQHQFADRILNVCNRGKELVTQILAFARTPVVAKQPVDLREVLAESRDFLTGSLPSFDTLIVEPGSSSLIVEADKSELQQIVVNLCMNAHDALLGKPGKISITASRMTPVDPDYHRMLSVGQLDPRRTYARLDVSDTGTGIAPEQLPHIFEPFFTTKERGRGTGLGLATVHGILQAYSGACAVESTLGRGTRFSVYLPVVEVASVTSQRSHTGNDLRGSERILVVDDEVDVADMLAIGLERLGYETVALNHPQEALEAFCESPASWDVVVVDQLMPSMKGVALAAKLKAVRPEVIVFLYTGLNDGKIESLAKARGVDAFFVKPVAPEKVAEAIRKVWVSRVIAPPPC